MTDAILILVAQRAKPRRCEPSRFVGRQRKSSGSISLASSWRSSGLRLRAWTNPAHRHGAPASPHRDIRCAAFSPTIGRELLELGLIDEIDLHIAPILLGEGIQLYDNPGVSPSVSTGSAKATPRQP